MGQPLQSTIDLLLNKLNKEGKVQHIDEQTTYEQFKEINKRMEEYEKEKQQKAAASADELSKVVLTT
jgi:ribosomal protein S21